MFNSIEALNASEKRRENDIILQIPADADEEEVQYLRRMQNKIMKEDMSNQMSKVNKLSLAIKYEASIAVEE